jgi:hypothetical protein
VTVDSGQSRIDDVAAKSEAVFRQQPKQPDDGRNIRQTSASRPVSLLPRKSDSSGGGNDVTDEDSNVVEKKKLTTTILDRILRRRTPPKQPPTPLGSGGSKLTNSQLGPKTSDSLSAGHHMSAEVLLSEGGGGVGGGGGGDSQQQKPSGAVQSHCGVSSGGVSGGVLTGSGSRIVRAERPKSLFPSTDGDMMLTTKGWTSELCLALPRTTPDESTELQQQPPPEDDQLRRRRRGPPPAVPVRRTSPLALHSTLVAPSDEPPPPKDAKPEVAPPPPPQVDDRRRSTRIVTSPDGRRSYLILADIVGENFTFLDEFEIDDMPGEVPAGEIPGVVQVAAVGGSNCAGPSSPVGTVGSVPDAAGGECIRRAGEKSPPEGHLLTRPAAASSSRKSIRLSNGTLVELVSDAFTFLDDYDDAD